MGRLEARGQDRRADGKEYVGNQANKPLLVPFQFYLAPLDFLAVICIYLAFCFVHVIFGRLIMTVEIWIIGIRRLEMAFRLVMEYKNPGNPQAIA